MDSPIRYSGGQGDSIANALKFEDETQKKLPHESNITDDSRTRHIQLDIKEDKTENDGNELDATAATTATVTNLAAKLTNVHFTSAKLTQKAIAELMLNSDIKTGASLIPDLNLVIEKMRRMPDDTFVYMCYMLPQTSAFFTPYSLHEVPFAAINTNDPFYTVTRNGVTFWHVSENFFTPLSQWQQEFQQFLSIIQIRTFSVFRLWKGFKVWEKTVKWKKLNAARDHLQNNLFIAIPQLAKAILRIRTELVQYEQFNFANISNIENWHAFYFLEMHMKIYEELTAIFTNFREQFSKVLYRACTDAIIAKGFYPDDEISYYPSIKKMLEAHSFMDRARKRAFCKTLTNFLAYCDMMVYQLLFQVTIRSFSDLSQAFDEHDRLGPTEKDIRRQINLNKTLEEPRPPEGAQAPFFLATLRLLPDRIDVEPSEEVVKLIFQRICGFILDSVFEIQSFTSDPKFSQYTRPSIMGRQEENMYDGTPNLQFLLRSDAGFQLHRKNIFALIRKAYDRTRLYAMRFHNIRENYEIDIGTDPAALVQERDLAQLRYYCERYCKNLQALDGILDKINLGMLSLTQTSFKETVTPVCQRLQNVLAAYLPKLAEEETLLVYELGQDFSTRISYEPTQTLDIVAHLRFLDACGEELDDIFSKVDYVHDLLLIIKDFQIHIEEDQKEDYLDMEDYINRTKELLEEMRNRKGIFIAQLAEIMQDDIERLREEIHLFAIQVIEPWLLDSKSSREKVVEKLNSLLEELLACRAKADELIGYQKEFKIDLVVFEEMDTALYDIRLRQNLYKTVEDWEQTLATWLAAEFNTLVVADLVELNSKTIKNCLQFLKYLPANNIVPGLLKSAEEFRDKLPVITYLRNPNLRARHWTEIEHLFGRKFFQEKDITIGTYTDVRAFSNAEIAETLMQISSQATGEIQLENMLKGIEAIWKETELSCVSHHDQKDVFILAGTEELQTVLDDSNVNINTIAASKFVGPIRSRVNEWIVAMEQFGKTFEAWMDCQGAWIYLEAIFASADIQRQLPNEAKMFFTVDKNFKEIVRNAKKISLALPTMSNVEVYNQLVENNRLLDLINRGLEAYLEVKRVVFPRFYFLSNDELLEILAQTRIPQAVQPHLRKCFDAVYRLEFGLKEGGDGKMLPTNDIIAFLSPEGEKLQFGKGLKARGAVEEWLSKVEEAMFVSVKRYMRFGYQCYPAKEREEWFQDHPNQVVLTVSQVQWAAEIHKIFDTKEKMPQLITDKMSKFEVKCLKDLGALAALTRKSITSLLRKVLCALITIDVHAKDSVRMLVEKGIYKSNDFNWLKMLRFYWNDELEAVYSRMAAANIQYYYEYLGAGGVLVLTPLTDRCYLCLMGAFQMDLGGAPAGPAGTGKTETTKDLAKAVAKQCVVFNCSDGLDYKMMGRFFSGLAQCGAWCCFDEFNRIDIEVLSVIAQQLITIRSAKVMKLKRFLFEGREIKLNRSCSVYITMNPGYAGRTELPDNLKALFRPISMMVPDYALISEVILYSEGFEDPKILARKMVQMYQLCSQQLSQQNHYDFGMRAVKSVLVMAGALKRASPDQREDITLIAALRDSNIPKFLADDAVLFRGILSDLFPGVELPDSQHPDLEEALRLGLSLKNLQPVPTTIRKCLQLYETMCVRWGVMLVGPTGGGKSVILHALEFAFNNLFELGVEDPNFRPVVIQTMNPKAVSMNELYGYVDPKTLEWQDGLLGTAVREAVQNEEEIHQWIMCDGPVDAVWIENLNTVLDDNKMLCLANSERIKLTAWIHMLFEVQDLLQASPATVSRCGMVYVDSADLGWIPLIDTWRDVEVKKELPSELCDFLYQLFIENFQKALKIERKRGAFTIHQVLGSKVKMACSLISTLIEEIKWSGIETTSAMDLLCKIFSWSVLWSIASNLRDDDKLYFEDNWSKAMATHPNMTLPKETMWNYRVDMETQDWGLWYDIMATFKYLDKVSYYDMQVPTVDTTKYGYVTDMLFKRDFPVMFTGETGVGKTVLAVSCMKRLSAGKVIPIILNFSAQTSSIRTQEMIEGPLEKRKRTQLGAPMGKTVIIFIDDVNMPKLDTYGSQPAVELLRQFLDFRGFYDREKLFWKEILNVVLGCACAPPGGGRNPLTPRFVRHFALFSLPKPNNETLTQIFKGILGGFLESFSSAIRALSDPIVAACVDVYMRVANVMLPTPDKSHYIFNLRDLSKCIQGILQANNQYYNMESQMLRLFYHETTRVFHDRLINTEDKTLFMTQMDEVCLEKFGREVVGSNEVSLLFGDFMVFGKPRNERLYEEIKDHAKLESVLNDYIEDFNSTAVGKRMKLILFQDAMEHTVRLARLLRSDRGNGLLVGVAGMGKQTLTRLGAHVNEYNCWQIEMRRNYDLNAFHEDLRVLYRIAGIQNKPVVFLLIDSQIVEEEFLEDINNILNSGEVPNLFEGDEYEKIILDARDLCNEIYKGGSCNRDFIYKFFINRVRNNLHVVMSMSPVGDAFRRRCRMFPSLVNCTTIDWFTSWPTEALYSVALGLLTTTASNMDDRVALASTTVFMHKTCEDASVRFYKEMKRHYYTTPSSYLELLKLYQSLLKLKTQEIIAKRKRIANGLNKLLETNEVIAVMQKELEVMVPQLDIKSATMRTLLENLNKESKQADAVKQSVMIDEASAKEKAGIAQAISEDASKDLEIAMPALKESEEALQALTKADINELKSFTTPPALVQFCMEAVCILLGAKPTWAAAKALMSDVNFIKRLFEYDKEHMKEDTLKKVKKYIEHKDFVPAKFEKVSKVAKSVSMWVIAMDKFAKIYKVVEPKIKRKEAAEAELKEVMVVLRQKQKELAAVEAKIQGLRDSLEEKQREFKVIQDNVDVTYGRINRAGRLTSALADEQIRWRETVKALTADLACVPGDVLVSSACVAYLGAFSHQYRRDMCKLWVSKCREHKIPSSSEFNLLKVLGDPYEMRQWNVDGLPKDPISIENGIYATRALRWALMIDPQEQANRWIRNMEKDNTLQVVKTTDPSLMRILENSVRQGLPVLLEELDENIDPSLRPILQRETYKFEGRIYLKMGDQVVDYDTNFKLYMTTKLPNPHYLPEVCINVTLVNFLVTESGLEDQLLADIVAIELPAMEVQRNDLVVKINADKGQLLQLEDKVLKLLFNSQGNILDDEELVETLNDAKETSQIIAARLIDTEETEKIITASRERYRVLASRGAILYFVVAGLAEIDPMYQYSLKYFSQVFCNVIRLEHPPMSTEVRIANLMIEELKAIYDNVSRGLFENHKLIFSFLLCMAVERQMGNVTEDEFGFLVRGAIGDTRRKTKPVTAKLSTLEWELAQFLEDKFPDVFNGFCDELAIPFFLTIGNTTEVFDFAQTNKEPTDKWNKRMKPFQKLMFISNFRKPRFLLNVVEYLNGTVGKYFTEASAGGTQLMTVFLDTSAITPLVFVLSTGSDPMSAFQKFAIEMKYTEKYYSISLGQGQGPVAEALIEKSLRLGHWVFLQNCHLATSFMRTLETIVRNLTLGITKANVDFRLFLSSMPVVGFPISVLQNSVKITNEPPKGIKANVMGALSDLNKEFFEQHIQREKWRAIIFGLCMFHAILLERRKFGPLGWNITYEFSESDRECGLKTLDFFINREIIDDIPWEALLYINGDITWGGRVTDYWDLRCLRTILTIFSSERIIDPDYKYCRGDTYYRDPRKPTLSEYITFVQNFPISEDPEIFGMNQNANIVFQTNETEFFLTTLMLNQPRSAADEGQEAENDMCQQIIDRIQKLLLPRLPHDNIHESLLILDNKGQMPSLTTVLTQEIDRFNISLNIIHGSLANLSKAIKGLVVMSEDLESVFKALLANVVPAVWAKRSYLSVKPLPSYIADYQRRLDFIMNWAAEGAPRSYWISGFFFPQSFLTGILQTYARKRVLPIDSLKIDFDIIERELVQQDFFEAHSNNQTDARLYGDLPACTDGLINVHGIFIEAARWDLSQGGVCDANFGELYSRLPVIRFKPCLEIHPIIRYEAPCYKTQQRSGVLSTTGHSTNFILSVLLRSKASPDFWIMRGTALVSGVVENVC